MGTIGRFATIFRKRDSRSSFSSDTAPEQQQQQQQQQQQGSTGTLRSSSTRPQSRTPADASAVSPDEAVAATGEMTSVPEEVAPPPLKVARTPPPSSVGMVPAGQDSSIQPVPPSQPPSYSMAQQHQQQTEDSIIVLPAHATSSSKSGAAAPAVGSESSIIPVDAAKMLQSFSKPVPSLELGMSITVNTEDPTDVVVGRLNGWKHLVKDYTAFYKEIMNIENETSKRYIKTLSALPLPMRDSELFLPPGSNGVQDVMQAVKKIHETVANYHTSVAQGIEARTLPELDRIYKEIKQTIRDTGGRLAGASKRVRVQRDESAKLIARLGRSVEQQRSSPLQVSHDPYLVNQEVLKQIKKQIDEENRFWQTVVTEQQVFSSFEHHLSEKLHYVLVSGLQLRMHDHRILADHYGSAEENLISLDKEAEWKDFKERHKKLVADENAQKTTLENVRYPLFDDPSVVALKSGRVHREKGMLGIKKYKPNHVTLTAAGFLHFYSTADSVAQHEAPDASVFLPDAELGPTKMPGTPSHSFIIVSGKKSSIPGASPKTFKLMFDSESACDDWWTTIRQRCKASLLTSETASKNEAIAAATASDALTSQNNSMFLRSDEEGEADEADSFKKDVFHTVGHATGINLAKQAESASPKSDTKRSSTVRTSIQGASGGGAGGVFRRLSAARQKWRERDNVVPEPVGRYGSLDEVEDTTVPAEPASESSLGAGSFAMHHASTPSPPSQPQPQPRQSSQSPPPRPPSAPRNLAVEEHHPLEEPDSFVIASGANVGLTRRPSSSNGSFASNNNDAVSTEEPAMAAISKAAEISPNSALEAYAAMAAQSPLSTSNSNSGSNTPRTMRKTSSIKNLTAKRSQAIMAISSTSAVQGGRSS